MDDNYITKFLNEHLDLFNRLFEIEDDIKSAGSELLKAIKKGKKILICGNGGSAADSQHFAAEIIGRFEIDRSALPAIALTTDTSILTAVGNDYGYDNIFSKQVEGLGAEGDVLVGITTSGNSENIVKAVKVAKQKNMITII